MPILPMLNPVKFARGFANFQKHMFPQQYDQFMTTLVLHFGRNQYFKRRRGDILLPPEEQEVIRLMLEKVGADSKMDFDKYEEHINWVFFSPAGVFDQEGKKTGNYRLGKDDLIVDAEGNSHISVQDYADAMVNELEKPAHHKERFTIGY